jgi:hypothetical protein
MRNVRVISVRWQRGIERISVQPDDTIATLLNHMVTKYNINEKPITMIQESNGAITAHRTKLSQLQLDNGEMFRM